MERYAPILSNCKSKITGMGFVGLNCVNESTPTVLLSHTTLEASQIVCIEFARYTRV